MEKRNIIKWSEYSGYTELTIPSGEIWMCESEMVDLFGVFIPKLRNAIKALYKEEQITPYTIKMRYRTKAPAPRLCADEVMSRVRSNLFACKART